MRTLVTALIGAAFAMFAALPTLAGPHDADLAIVHVLVTTSTQPLVGASVVLDLDGNGVWDEHLGEPRAWTGSDGIAIFHDVVSIREPDAGNDTADGGAPWNPPRLLTSGVRGSVGARAVEVDFVMRSDSQQASLALYDVRGRRLARVAGSGDLELPVPLGVPAGVYFLQLRSDTGESSTLRFTSVGRRTRSIKAYRLAAAEAVREGWSGDSTGKQATDEPAGYQINLLVQHDHFPPVVKPVVLFAGENYFTVNMAPAQGLKVLALTFFPGGDSRPLPAPTVWISPGGTRWDDIEPDQLHVFGDAACGGFSYLEANVADAPGECSSHESYRISTRSCGDGAFGGVAAVVPNLYFDFRRFLPEGVTIVDAVIAVQDHHAFSAIPFAANEGLIAALDTFAVDGRWLEAAGGCNANPWSKRANWWYADIDAQTPWQGGALGERCHLYKFGLTGDWTHGGTAPFTAGVDTVVFDVARQIQYALDYGVPNHGFWLLALRLSSMRFYLACGISESTNRHRNPTLWIVYREVPHAQPWQGHAFAWSFGTDDQCIDQLAYPAVVEAYAPAARMTWWLTGALWMDPAQDWAVPRVEIPANRILPATMRDLYEDGHEIAQHTRTHGARGYWPIYGASLIQQPPSLASADSVLYEIERRWLAEIIGIADTLAIAGHAQPAGGYGALDAVALAAMGYRYARGSWVGPHHAEAGAFNDPDHEMHPWQSINPVQNLALGDTVNIFTLDNNLSTSLILGPGYDNDRETVFAVLDREFERAWRFGQYPLLTFSHGFADPALSACPDYTTSILDCEQLAWIMQYMTERRRDVWIARLIDIVDRYRSIATPVAPPASVAGYSIGEGGRHGITAACGVFWHAPRRGPWLEQVHDLAGPTWPPALD